jgi:type VI protein secretion system component VasF
MDTISSTVLATGEALLPTLLVGAGVGQVSSVAVLLPAALSLLNTAQQLTSAGMMTQEQLAQLFTTIGANIQASHTAWVAAGSPQS